MAGTLIEKRGSRTVMQERSRVSSTWLMLVIGAASEEEAYALASAYIPPTYHGMLPESLGITECHGVGMFSLEARYSSVQPETSSDGSTTGSPSADLPTEQQPAAGGDSNAVLPGGFSFSIGTESEHITSSIATVDKFRDTTLLPVGSIDFKQSIGVGANKQVTGCERPRPVGTFSLEFTAVSVSVGNLLFWQSVAGQTNSLSWGIWKARTLTFEGIEGAIQIGSSAQSVRANFRYWPPTPVGSPARQVGDITIGNPKAGTDYEWVYYLPNSKGDMVPVQVNHERVMHAFDFRKLGLGNGPGGTTTGV